jgi:UTP--glucose-1-phosphate uridylyltransferase
MLPVGRKPVVQYVVEEMTRVGVQRILFITGPGKSSIENHFDLNGELIQHLRESGKEDLLEEFEYERAPVQYFYTRQRQLLGLGHAVLCAQPFVDQQPFVVALGDSIIGLHAQSDIVRRMSQCFDETGALAVVAFEQVPRDQVNNYGIAKPKSSGEVFELADVVEKPSVADAPSELAIAARYVFAPAIFDALAQTKPGKGGEIQLTDAIRALIQRGDKVYGMKLREGERRFDIGNYDSYFRAFVEFALADEKHGAALHAQVEQLIRDSHS